MKNTVLIIGAGWAGVTVAEMLQRSGVSSEIIEGSNKIGGHSRSEKINGVIYEPNGPHIFHTSNPKVNNFVTSFGMTRKFKHEVKTRIYPVSLGGESILVSWPPQVDELKQLAEWRSIENELNALPIVIDQNNFETYAISIMGPTLYSLFIEGYTLKQWGTEAKNLSSEFAPKRIDLRKDGNKALFNDEWEYFHPGGSGEIIEKIAKNKSITFDTKMDINSLLEVEKNYDYIVITAPLDDFLNTENSLPWRGIKSVPEIYSENTVTEAYQINHPSLVEEYTRTVETKHASGQEIEGTIVCKEYSFPNIRHYPILTNDGDSKNKNKQLKSQISNMFNPKKVEFCGRLANYQYINQDQAIEQGFETADKIIEKIKSDS